MKITHISAYDITGGAARSAYRLHLGLRSLGHESRMLVNQKDSFDPNVILYDGRQPLLLRLRRRMRRRYIERSQKAIRNLAAGGGYYSDDRSQYGGELLKQLPRTDVLNLHWVAGTFDYREFFSQLPKGLPVVWTLHDMNPFTGGCHFDAGCGRFQAQCGACPQLGSTDPRDFSHRAWTRKKEAFDAAGRGRIHIVAPSRWLAAEAKRSSLLGGYASTVIPYGIDTEKFQPRDRKAAREKFGLPGGAKIVLFAADWAGEKRKGLELFLQAMEGLEASDLCLVAVGKGLRPEQTTKRVVAVDYVTGEEAMSQLYSSADVFVAPSLQDNLPNTALEALACGTPIAAFAAGGLADIVRGGETGRLVAVGDVAQLRRVIEEMLRDSELRAAMAEKCRKIALEEYTLEKQARRYGTLYEELISQAHDLE